MGQRLAQRLQQGGCSCPSRLQGIAGHPPELHSKTGVGGRLMNPVGMAHKCFVTLQGIAGNPSQLHSETKIDNRRLKVVGTA